MGADVDMLTSLSRSVRQILASAVGRASAAAPASAPIPSDAGAPATRTLRLVRPLEARPDDRDTSIRVAAGASIGASAFVAGAGARLYSLDVFRSERRNGSPHPTQPVSPRAA
jgi:hypothetical protein